MLSSILQYPNTFPTKTPSSVPALSPYLLTNVLTITYPMLYNLIHPNISVPLLLINRCHLQEDLLQPAEPLIEFFPSDQTARSASMNTAQIDKAGSGDDGIVWLTLHPLARPMKRRISPCTDIRSSPTTTTTTITTNNISTSPLQPPSSRPHHLKTVPGTHLEQRPN